MATGLDQVVGTAMMSLGSLIFIYYSLWVIVLPFVEADHVIQIYFPDRMYAILIPVVAGVLAVLVVGMNSLYQYKHRWTVFW
ncbi:dolichol phosphate-mannose biosynthesis regulatory [Paramuricea clavata]|uniref:Dolichol phosphate-mannose biosynthesis regulatory protein n=1 Tax=Paramuricea clavata TaxID=317549 RepID=A0A6S7HWD1_PARCT|nr:dolichol phosphate-mannose biosynthesis regulatory [Paramuricea clavata]